MITITEIKAGVFLALLFNQEGVLVKQATKSSYGEAFQALFEHKLEPIKRSAITELVNKSTKKKKSPAKILDVTVEGLLFARWFKKKVEDNGFDTKHYNEPKWAQIYDKLESEYGKTIYDICGWALDNSFWAENFRSPLKLTTKNKEGIRYIEVFAGKSFNPARSAYDEIYKPKDNNNEHEEFAKILAAAPRSIALAYAKAVDEAERTGAIKKGSFQSRYKELKQIYDEVANG